MVTLHWRLYSRSSFLSALGAATFNYIIVHFGLAVKKIQANRRFEICLLTSDNPCCLVLLRRRRIENNPPLAKSDNNRQKSDRGSLPTYWFSGFH